MSVIDVEVIDRQYPQVSVHEATSEKMDFNSKNFRYVTSGFQSFINTAQAHGKVYLRALSAAEPSGKATSLKADFPGLAADFHLPSELDWVENNIHSSVLRISGPVNMWLHYDVSDAEMATVAVRELICT